MYIEDLPRNLARELEGQKTVSDKIRLLDRAGYARADIARVLGKRYQHVRNVLEADRKPATVTLSAVAASATDVMRLEVSRDGRLMLPPHVLQELQIPEGGALAARIEDGELRLADPLVALRKVQEMLRPLREQLRQQGISLVDELIADRRAEARREAEE